MQQQSGLLGDTPKKAYTHKLDLFNRFAEPELRTIIANLDLNNGDTVLDAGCGTGLITGWLADVVQNGTVVGIDLSTGHLQHASALMRRGLYFLQTDMAHLSFNMPTFDLIWSSNAINHLRRPIDGIRHLVQHLQPGGRLVLGQSAFLPDMFFAWDARLEKEVMLACRQYYRDKYNLDERETTHVRNLFGWLKEAGLREATVTTVNIERTAPLTLDEETYFVEGVFNGYWGHRVKPYLSPDDWLTLSALCDPNSSEFALRRPDFHHIQTFTVAIGQR